MNNGIRRARFDVQRLGGRRDTRRRGRDRRLNEKGGGGAGRGVGIGKVGGE